MTRRELGIAVTGSEHRGIIEYPSHYPHDMEQPVGLVFEVASYQGELKLDDEAAAGGWFTSLPTPMHADQDIYLATNYDL